MTTKIEVHWEENHKNNYTKIIKFWDAQKKNEILENGQASDLNHTYVYR